jgi:cellulose biosynthesis protein BcsQ
LTPPTNSINYHFIPTKPQYIAYKKLKPMEKLNEIRDLMKDREDLSYTIINKLIDILEFQTTEISRLNGKIDRIKSKIE